MKDKDLLNLLKKNGWEIKRIHGSHYIMQKKAKPKQSHSTEEMFLPAY